MHSIMVTESSGVGVARRISAKVANGLNLSEILTNTLSIIVSEAANNLLKHTPMGGEIIINTFLSDSNQSIVNVLALDKGPGISNLSQCLTDGYSTSRTMGTGLGAIKRLSTTFDIYTGPNLGTVLWSQLVVKHHKIKEGLSKTKLVNPIQAAAICIPLKGQTVCGDNCAMNFPFPYLQGMAIVIDGLGHGEGAFLATEEALSIFDKYKNSDLSLDKLFENIHKALEHTRGAAGALVKFDFPGNKLEFMGIGNVSGVMVANGKRKSMLTMNGIIGLGSPTLHTVSYSLAEDFVFIMHSDGLMTNWDIIKYPGLVQKSSNLIAGVLYRDYKKERDDSTILVIKKARSTLSVLGDNFI